MKLKVLKEITVDVVSDKPLAANKTIDVDPQTARTLLKVHPSFFEKVEKKG